MTNPGLFIVAGPNGAGKSLFSKKLTDSAFEVFDGAAALLLFLPFLTKLL